MITLQGNNRAIKGHKTDLTRVLYRLYKVYRHRGQDITRVNLTRHINDNKAIRNRLQIITFYMGLAVKRGFIK